MPALKNYPSNISYEQFQKILPILESAIKQTRPRKVNFYEVFSGVLYVVKSACQWRMIPNDYPNWKILHYYFTVWSKKRQKTQYFRGYLGKTCPRNAAKKSKQLSQLFDAQSVKNTDSAREKDYDAGIKKFQELKDISRLIIKNYRMESAFLRQIWPFETALLSW